MNNRFKLTPIRLTVLSFFALIFLGTVLLMLPISTQGLQATRFMDALFTATSAVCVTGLVVQDTGGFFSQFGQIIILSLIQLGGLGIMTLYASLPVIFGRQLKISQRRMFSAIFDVDNYASLRSMLKAIVLYTFVIESIGAILLSLRFYMLWGDAEKALYYGIFHSISAFCNAGFMLFSNGLNDFSSDIFINLIIISLFVLGGIGFIVIHQFLRRKSFKKLSANSRLAVVTTFFLILIPCFFIFHFEFDNALAGKNVLEKTLVTLMQVTSTRTAGFNTVDINTFGNSSLFLICILMFVGASPGGTGGGVKTTTCGLLFLSVRSIFRGRSNIECYGREVPQDVITRSIALISVAFTIVTIFIMALMMVEDAPFLDIFFEVISAFSTVGLSLGLTPDLSLLGKFLISLVMFIGRIGTLSLIFMIGRDEHVSTYDYPTGRFMVG
jgi:trk system potassium uptake protein